MFVFTLKDVFAVITLAIAGVIALLCFIFIIINMILNKVKHKFKGEKDDKTRKNN